MNYVKIRIFLFNLLFILLCVQIYWILQIYNYKLSKKLHIRLVLIQVFVTLIGIIIVMNKDIIPFTSLICLCIMILLLFCISLYQYKNDIYYFHNSISNESIVEGLNNISEGFCFYDQSGLPLLMNELIESISQSLTGDSLASGIEFWKIINGHQSIQGKRLKAVNPTILLENGKVYSFSNQMIIHHNEKFYQLLASDVTDLYSMSKQIEEDNRVLASVNHRLQLYNQQVSLLIRDEEILKSKIRIHDNLGHSIIATKYLLSNQESNIDQKELISMWRTNISLLNKEDNKENQEDIFETLKNAASVIGLDLIIEGTITNMNENNKKVLMIAIKECMTNAVQHAKAKKLYINIKNNQKIWQITLHNDGLQPDTVNEGGGLTSLRNQVESINGTMKKVFVPDFSIIIELPYKEL